MEKHPSDANVWRWDFTSQQGEVRKARNVETLLRIGGSQPRWFDFGHVTRMPQGNLSRPILATPTRNRPRAWPRPVELSKVAENREVCRVNGLLPRGPPWRKRMILIMMMTPSWVYLAEIKNFKHEKETIAKKQGTEKTEGYRVVAPWLVDKVCSKPSLRRSSKRGKELPDNAVAQGMLGCNRSFGESGAQIRKDLGIAEKVWTQLKWNSARFVITLSHLASSTIVCSGYRMRMSHPMKPSYCWNREAGSSWDRVFWKSHVRTLPPEVIRCLTRCSCKTKERQQQHNKKQITQTHTKRKRFKCKSHGNMYKKKSSLL